MEDLSSDVDLFCQEFEELRSRMSVACLRYAATNITRIASEMTNVADSREQMLREHESKCPCITDAAVSAFNSWIQATSRADRQRATERLHDEITGSLPADGVTDIQVSFACDAIAAGVPVGSGEMDAVAEAHIVTCWTNQILQQ